MTVNKQFAAIAMTVNKQFAQDGGDLDALMDQLVEVLAQLLDEPASPHDQDPAPAIRGLAFSGRERHPCH